MGDRLSIALDGGVEGAARHRKLISLACWMRRLRDVAEACGSADESDEVGLLRELWALLARAPALLGGLMLPGAEWFEARLSDECCDSAALAIIGADAGYMLSRGAQDHHLATLVLPGDDEEYTASGHTLALALTGVIAVALMQTILRGGLPEAAQALEDCN